MGITAISVSYFHSNITGAATYIICKDSDATITNKGIDITITGKTTWAQDGRAYTKKDQCTGEKLAEWYCNNNKGAVQEITCPEHSKCKEGSCTIKSCTPEVRSCPDGSYVGRDPANNCKFRTCKPTCGNGICEQEEQQTCTQKICIPGNCPQDCTT